MRSSLASTLMLVAMALLLPAGLARGQTPTVLATFDHLQSPAGGMTARGALKAKQAFTVRITKTCVEEFTYTMHGLKSTAPAGTRAQSSVPQLTDVDLAGAYDDQFGSYLITVSRKQQTPQCFKWVNAMGEVVTPIPPTAQASQFYEAPSGDRWAPIELTPTTFVAVVDAITWEVGQDAALSAVPNAVRAWATEATSVMTSGTGAAGQATTTKYKVVRDSTSEDSARLSFATLTHFYFPERSQGFALGFGLVDNKLEYYGGYSFGLGSRDRRFVNFSFGAVLTPVTQLPKGIREDDLLTAASDLNPADFRTALRVRPYFAITATFFKPSAPAKPQAPAN